MLQLAQSVVFRSWTVFPPHQLDSLRRATELDPVVNTVADQWCDFQEARDNGTVSTFVFFEC